MKQSLDIRISKKPMNTGTLACRQVSVREKIISKLLGKPVKLTILVPGDSVEEVQIREM